MGFFDGLLGNSEVVSTNELNGQYGKLLAENETIQVGFVVITDTFIFTDKRLILIDVQGLTGKKIEYLSIPYSKITKYSIETAGTFDLDAELKIWVGSDAIPIQKKFNSKVNVYDLQKVLATYVG